MGNQPLLSVCIPTYNRAQYLDLALGTFCAQIAACGRSDIKLLVSDNASTDDTSVVISRHQKAFPSLTVLRNESNIGAEGNFLGLLRAATGRFCWIFGDDDLLLDGGLGYVIEVLDHHREIGILHIASSWHKVRAQALLTKARYGEPEVSEGRGDFLHKIGFSITFITGNIFNKTYLDPHFDYSSFKGTNLLQVSFYLQSFLHGKGNIYMAGSVYSAMSNNTGGYGLLRTFGPNLNYILSGFADRGFKRQWVRAINRKLCLSFFPDYLVRIGASGGRSKFNHEPPLPILWPVYKSYPEFWIFVLPLTILPVGVARGYYRLSRFVIESAKALRRVASGRQRGSPPTA
jgi:abequosyltransferase